MTSYNLHGNDAWFWLVDGWNYFWRKPLIWLLMTLLYIIAVFVLNQLPHIGPFVAALATPLLLGGMLFAMRELDQGREIGADMMLIAVRNSELIPKLLVLGVLPTAVVLVYALLPQLGLSVMVTYLLTLVASLVALGTLLFAAPLVLFDSRDSLHALKTSFTLCIQNVVPVAVFLALEFCFFIPAALLFGLGLLLYVPVMIGAIYACYRRSTVAGSVAAADGHAA